MTHSLVLIALVTFACGIPFGLLLRSAKEARVSPELRLFVLDGIFGLVATVVERAVVGLTLIFVPSLGLLWLANAMPHGQLEMRVWWTSNLLGIALGKVIRWLRWRSKQDFM